ncbi:MAG: hypothetical protein V1797_04325 [Pseudomonadota bacterium]
MLAAPAPVAAGDSFHLSLGLGAPAFPYPPPVVVAPPAYYGGAVVVVPPRARWRHHHGYYPPPRHYVWTAPPGYRHDGRRGPDRRWR